ncbi:hypothetical protein KCP78_25575 [Salmonella enterica subsp. enterica]|nr:hypothetical protein KCP78_25575 [Salmonella enterica subsp. enterica]
MATALVCSSSNRCDAMRSSPQGKGSRAGWQAGSLKSQFPEGSQGDAQCPGDMNIRRRRNSVAGRAYPAARRSAYLLDGQRPQRDRHGCCERWRAVFSPSGIGKRTRYRAAVTFRGVVTSCVSGYSFYHCHRWRGVTW